MKFLFRANLSYLVLLYLIAAECMGLLLKSKLNQSYHTTEVKII